jgi:hypothetical protein
VIKLAEIAYSLMHQTVANNLNGPLRHVLHPQHAEASSTTEEVSWHGAMNASYHCLGLLADVMNLLYHPAVIPEQNSDQQTGQGRVQKDREWKRLYAGLSSWHKSRPAEQRPLFTNREDESTSFPTLLFASTAGTASNMLHHASMLLLLSNRPMAITLAELEPESPDKVSPLWHARQVCGIAVHSDRRCWDPCMLAAYFLGARRLAKPTPSQRDEMLGVLEDVKVSGWNVDGLVRRLQEEWTGQ